MNLNIATTDDLQQLKTEIITEITKLLSSRNSYQPITTLKSKDVRRILNCSDSKLDVLRNTGMLPFKKLCGVHYYKLEDVESLLDYNK